MVEQADRVGIADEPIDWARELRPCSHGCPFGTLKGMGTNGGCEHLQLGIVGLRHLLQRVIKVAREKGVVFE